MLHQVPDSALRGRLLLIVFLQRRLVQALCALPAGSTVDLNWLQQTAWPRIEKDWIRRFWENQKAQRQEWMNTIAGADAEAKQVLLQIMGEQHRFKRLYDESPVLKLTETNQAFWKETAVRLAMRSLLLDFYEPWLGQQLGYPTTLHNGSELLNRQEYLRTPELKVCPYCDNGLQCAELDHFLPKSLFPFLSVHPDNLIPACHDSNRGDHKGDTPPLDWNDAAQAANWFHPRWRPAHDRFRLDFYESLQDRSLQLSLEAVHVEEHQRVVNLDQMFKLAQFWGRTLEDDMQAVQREVVSGFIEDGQTASNTGIIDRLDRLYRQHEKWIGRRPLHMYWTAVYAFVRDNPALVADILRQFKEDSAA